MPDSLTIHLVNRTTTPLVFAYITGLAIQSNSARVFLQSDGHTLHYPPSPPDGQILQPLTAPVAIPLGPPGNTVAVTIPQIAGGRIWFSRGERQLVFLRNPGGPGGGAALVEPSVLNPSDPNADVDFAFCEFTLNGDQLFANISYVDFVSRLPVALTLAERDGGGKVQHVAGMGADGLERVCEGLRAQAEKDGRPWDRLIVQQKGGEGRPLRALSPTHGGAVGVGFEGYFEGLVERAWERYREGHRGLFHRGSEKLRINTQAAAGVVDGHVDKGTDELVVGGERFAKPTTADILGCNSGPFTTGPSPTRNAIIPRLAAAFQRSCIVDVAEHPSHPDTFYKCEPTNHYARIVHECNLDGKGYAFAYDDVQMDGGEDQSGKVNAGDPEVLVVEVGGEEAYVGDRMG
ncbi:glucanase b [Bombardia bombarda]|uniref:Glucanase b n=1 Tax=Bombardia bombarda TaxID=252184 RepID=A0AA40CG24_9PEZI|nr:glucanase b [Bombardia bombarda]